MVSDCIMLVFLGLLAWIDIRKQKLPLLPIALFGGAGFALFLWTSPFLWKELWGGVAVGGGVLFGAVVTRESIGMGDGILLCATGIYLGLRQNLILFFLAVMFAAVTGLVYLIKKKCGRKQRIPFVPFLLAADILLLWSAGFGYE